jgi:hypothetical protein
MASQLDLLKATSSRAVYETLEFSELHPTLEGSIRFRINPTRKMWAALQAAHQSQENEAFFELTAQLLPRATDDDTPLTADEFKDFLNNDPDADPLFAFWLARKIYGRISKHFLAVTQSAKA